MPVLPSHASHIERDLTLLSTQTTVFNIFASLGVFSIVAVLGPALLSSRVKRSRTWFGVLAAWLVYSVSYLLLIGRQFGPEPPLGLCMFQAAFIYATSPLCAVATTCFAIDFALKLSMVKVRGKSISRRTANMLIITPWILGIVIVAEAILSVRDVTKVHRDANHFYCHIVSQVPTLINSAIILFCGLIINLLGIYTAVHLHRNWAILRRLGRNHAHVALSTCIRLTLFGVIVTLAMFMSIFNATHVGDDDNVLVYGIMLTTLPTFSALFLGTQRDILGAWLFWKKRESTPPPLPPKSADLPITEYPEFRLYDLNITVGQPSPN